MQQIKDKARQALIAGENSGVLITTGYKDKEQDMRDIIGACERELELIELGKQ